MKTALYLFLIGIMLVFFNGCKESQEKPGTKKEFQAEFKGKIAKTYEESEEWWPKKKRPPKDAPNVIIFLLDDVGFAQVGSFGGLIETPNIDKLADNGLRYNNFRYNRQKGGYFGVLMSKWTKRRLYFSTAFAYQQFGYYLCFVKLNGSRLCWRATCQGYT